MVSANIIQRYLGSEKIYALIEKSSEQCFVIGHYVHHVSVVNHHITLLVIALFKHLFHNVHSFVNVVENKKRCFGLRRIVCGERQRSFTIHVCCSHISVNDMPAFALQHLLRVDAIAIFRSGLQTCQFHGVHFSGAFHAYVGVIILGTALGIEICSVIRRKFHPAIGFVVGGPNYCCLSFVNILKIWSVGYGYSVSAYGNRENCQKHCRKQKFDFSIHRLL